MRKCDLYIHHTSIYDDNSYSPWVNPKFVAIGIIATLAVISLLIAVTSLDGTPVCEATGGGENGPDDNETVIEEPKLYIISKPDKTNYYAGEVLNLSGIGLRYGNQSISLSDCTYSPRYVPRDQSPGVFTISLKYLKNPQATCTFTVDVLEDQVIIEGIAPYYHVSDTIDRSSITVKIIDYKGERYVNAFTISPTDVDENTKKIALIYENHPVDVPITVVPRSTKIVHVTDVDSDVWNTTDSTFMLPEPQSQPGFFEGWYSDNGRYLGGSGERITPAGDLECHPRWTPFGTMADGLGLRIISYSVTGADSSVVIPDTISNKRVYAVGSGAFDGCYMVRNVTVPESVIRIEDGAFRNMSALASVSVDVANSSYRDIEGVLYSKDGSELVCCPNAFGSVLEVSKSRLLFRPYSIPESVSTLRVIGDVEEMTFAPYSHGGTLSVVLEAEGAYTPTGVFADPDFGGTPIDTIQPSKSERHYYVQTSASISLSSLEAAVVVLAMVLSITICLLVDKTSGNTPKKGTGQ